MKTIFADTIKELQQKYTKLSIVLILVFTAAGLFTPLIIDMKNQILTSISSISFVIMTMSTFPTMVTLLGVLGAEGQVYKPKNDYFFKPDDYDNIHYPVVKHKYDAWLETNKIKVKHEMSYSANELKLITAVESRVTPQRLLNVLSHGDIKPEPQSTGLVIKAMLQDIKEEPDIDVNNGTLFGKQGGKIAALFKQHLTEIE